MPKVEIRHTNRWQSAIDRRKAEGGHISGFCNDALQAELLTVPVVLSGRPEEWHARCHGAVTNGAGKTSLCRCDCHDHEARCHECGYEHLDSTGFDPSLRRCVDRAECAQRIALAIERSRNSPEMQEIYRIREEARAEVAARKAEDRAKREAAALERGEVPEVASEPTKRAKIPQKCHCGCGGLTKGGNFMMGHDMKTKGPLFARARGKTGEDAVEAALEILAREWNAKGIEPEVLAEASKRLRELGPEKAVVRAVTTRYEGAEQ